MTAISITNQVAILGLTSLIDQVDNYPDITRVQKRNTIRDIEYAIQQLRDGKTPEQVLDGTTLATWAVETFAS